MSDEEQAQTQFYEIHCSMYGDVLRRRKEFSVSYSEKDNLVILTMSREDYQLVLMLLGAGMVGERIVSWLKGAALLNRLNEGNPNYTPYQVEAEK